jgi:hypothetical protein
MASQIQIDSARRNGARSRGPATAEGKSKSAGNSLKHGLSSKKIFVLANESNDAFNDTVEAIKRIYQPSNELEHELLSRDRARPLAPAPALDYRNRNV